MAHHMYERTTSTTLYLTYATVIVGLMVCSILSPIRTVTVGERSLRLYGVAVAFDPPPVNWENNTTDSSSSSSSLDESSAWVDSVGSLSLGSADRSSATSLNERLAFDTLVFTAATSSMPAWAAASGAKVSSSASSDAASPVASASFSSSLSGSGSGSETASNATKTQWVYVHKIPSSALRHHMTAYIVFNILCLFFCMLLIFCLFAQILPIGQERVFGVAIRVHSVVISLTAVLCFAMAAALGLQRRLLRGIADGYYGDANKSNVVSRLNSGFSTAVAAAFVGLVVNLFAPLIWEQ